MKGLEVLYDIPWADLVRSMLKSVWLSSLRSFCSISFAFCAEKRSMHVLHTIWVSVYTWRLHKWHLFWTRRTCQRYRSAAARAHSYYITSERSWGHFAQGALTVSHLKEKPTAAKCIEGKSCTTLCFANGTGITHGSQLQCITMQSIRAVLDYFYCKPKQWLPT